MQTMRRGRKEDERLNALGGDDTDPNVFMRLDSQETERKRHEKRGK